MTDTTKPVEPIWVYSHAAGGFEACKTEEQAHKEAYEIGREMTVQSYVPATALDAANAEIERLTKELDRRTNMPGDFRYWEGRYRDEKADNERLIAESAALVAALASTMEWIDAVPSDTPLPTMPGFDRDAVDQLIADATAALEAYGAAKVREGWEAGMKEAAQISRNHGFMMDIDWWIKTTKKEVSVFSCNSVAESILAAIKEKQP